MTATESAATLTRKGMGVTEQRKTSKKNILIVPLLEKQVLRLSNNKNNNMGGEKGKVKGKVVRTIGQVRIVIWTGAGRSIEQVCQGRGAAIGRIISIDAFSMIVNVDRLLKEVR